MEAPRAAAERARLSYVRAGDRGYSRRRAGKGFVYFDARGRPIRDRATIERIRAIVIPPAWTDVWICTRADGHIQATGRDARGRKQYRYHPRWREVRDGAKFGELASFAQALPALRSAIDRDLRRRALDRNKVIAAVVKLLDTTLIRVGNDEYARANASYGLTTLEDRHVSFRDGRVILSFCGKSGVHRRVVLEKKLARIVAECRAVPGPGLFQYFEGERTRSVSSCDVNAYIRAIAGMEHSAKCFRTWGGTVYAAAALSELGPPSSARDGRRKILDALRSTADRLGNTPAVCRASYVHPRIFEAYADGSLEQAFARCDPEAAVLALIAPARMVRRAA